MSLSALEIVLIAKRISDISELGLFLQFDEDEVDAFEKENDKDSTVNKGTQAMLKTWNKKEGSTKEKLVEALRLSDMEELGDAVAQESMASKVARDELQDATTLDCGDTFYKECLKPEWKSDDLDACPVSREAEQIHSPPSEESEKSFGKEKLAEEKLGKLEQTEDGVPLPDAVDEGLLALGNLNIGETATATSEQGVKNDGDGNRDKERDQLGACSIPPAVPNNIIEIVQDIFLRDGSFVYGMSAFSQDSVVVSYGIWKKGVDRFFLSGDKQQYLGDDAGNVHDIAVLSDGRSVVSNIKKCLVYNSNGIVTDQFYHVGGSYASPRICSDPDDNIYVVNGNPFIHISHPDNVFPPHIIPVNSRPFQICVTKTGLMITSTHPFLARRPRVSVHDKSGRACSSIESEGDWSVFEPGDFDYENLFAVVDSLDRVLIARVTVFSSEFILTRYTIKGTKLIEQTAFEVTYLSKKLIDGHCCMVSLAPDMMAFANGVDLYFIKLPS